MQSFDLKTYFFFKIQKPLGAKEIGLMKCSTAVLRAQWDRPCLSVLYLMSEAMLQLLHQRALLNSALDIFFKVAPLSQLIS